MTSEEKGKWLVDRFTPHCDPENDSTGNWLENAATENAKACALICVDEILNVLEQDFGVNTSIKQQYWQEVKQIIAKI